MRIRLPGRTTDSTQCEFVVQGVVGQVWCESSKSWGSVSSGPEVTEPTRGGSPRANSSSASCAGQSKGRARCSVAWDKAASAIASVAMVSESDAEQPCRNVVPRTDDDLPDTVPASQTALHDVGRLVCPEQVPMHDMDALEKGVDHGQTQYARRVVLHPQSSGGTPSRSPEMLMRGNRFAALAGTETVAMPASTGSFRRVGHQRLGAEPSSADDTLLDSAGPTQWESEEQFSIPDGGSGLSGNAPESDLLGDSDPMTIPTRSLSSNARNIRDGDWCGWRCSRQRKGFGQFPSHSRRSSTRHCGCVGVGFGRG